jgi:hypothetical protein
MTAALRINPRKRTAPRPSAAQCGAASPRDVIGAPVRQARLAAARTTPTAVILPTFIAPQEGISLQITPVPQGLDLCEGLAHEPVLCTRYSTITCPACGHRKDQTMPTDACVWFYECEHCKTVLEPKPGDCCMYCSYGT